MKTWDDQKHEIANRLVLGLVVGYNHDRAAEILDCARAKLSGMRAEYAEDSPTGLEPSELPK